MTDLAKLLIVGGVMLVVAGVLVYLFGKIPGVGKLPGDIVIKKENFTLYVPLMTCLLLSLIISVLMYLWHQK